jgi:hypothetical protein
VIEIYNKLMKLHFVTLFPEELFAISPNMGNQRHEAITPKRVPFIEEVLDKETSVTVPNVYGTYLNNLAPGERAIPLNVTEESYAL